MIVNNMDKAGMQIVLPGAGGIWNQERCQRAEQMLGLKDIMYVEQPQCISVEQPYGQNSVGHEYASAQEGCDYTVIAATGAKCVELKSIASYLSRHHGDRMPKLNVPCGTLPFELLNENGSAWGWLHHLFVPDDTEIALINGEYHHVIWKKLQENAYRSPNVAQDVRRTTYVEPDYLMYILFRYSNGEEPFASIAFEWGRLRERLNEIAGGMLDPAWKLPMRVDGILSQEWADGWIVQGIKKRTACCWHVPMSQLKDIACITIIEGQLQENGLSYLERVRLEWLRKYSGGRRLRV